MLSQAEQKYQRLRRELTLGIAALLLVLLTGAIGYRIIEGWSWLNALYMTVITLSTVGFSEVQPLTPEGRIFTITLIFMGIASFGYILNRFTEALFEGYFQEGLRLRQRRRLIDSLSEHYILCGYGRTGRQIALEFAAETIPFLVIDFQPESVEASQRAGYTTLLGDATIDETLLAAGIERAACLISALPSDAENLYTIISAKTLNPGIRTIARANTEEALKKLQRGGADVVVSPYITGGKRMAAAALRPQMMDFVDGILTGSDRSLYMEELRIDPENCPLIGQTIGETELRSQSGALVLAIRRADGTLIGGPTPDTKLHAGDIFICMGTGDQLQRLNQLLSPGSRPPRFPKKRS